MLRFFLNQLMIGKCKYSKIINFYELKFAMQIILAVDILKGKVVKAFAGLRINYNHFS